jgi:hypothetical protein
VWRRLRPLTIEGMDTAIRGRRAKGFRGEAAPEYGRSSNYDDPDVAPL